MSFMKYMIYSKYTFIYFMLSGTERLKQDQEINYYTCSWLMILVCLFISCIVNSEDWLCPANIKGTNNEAKIYSGRSATVHSLLFCLQTCISNLTNTFLLTSFSVRSKQLLCFVKSKNENGNIQQRTLSSSYHPLLLTIVVKTVFLFGFQMMADLMFRKNEYDSATFHFQQLLERKPGIVPDTSPMYPPVPSIL